MEHGHGEKTDIVLILHPILLDISRCFDISSTQGLLQVQTISKYFKLDEKLKINEMSFSLLASKAKAM